jgi:hypothetical protein
MASTADDDVSDVEDTGDAPADDAKGGEDWTPPTREEHDKMTRALERANKEAQRRREEAKTAKEQATAGQQAADQDAVKAAVADAVAAERARLIPGLLRGALADAGIPEGVRAAAVALAARHVDQLELQADGTLSGVQDVLDLVREQAPGLFAPAGEQQRRKAPPGDTGRQSNAPVAKDSASVLARRMGLL